MKNFLFLFSLLFIITCNPSSSHIEENEENGITELTGVVASDQLLALQSYWNELNADNLTTSSYYRQQNLGDSFSHLRVEGLVFSEQISDTKPLKLFWNNDRKDYFLTSTPEGEKDAKDTGYDFMGIEGFVFSTEKPNTVPLKLFWNPFRQDNFTTATEIGEKDALEAGYTFIRTEGYIFPFIESSIEDDISKYLEVFEPETSAERYNPVVIPIFIHSLERYFSGSPADNKYEAEIVEILDEYPQTHEFFKEVVEKYNSIPLESKLKKYDSKIVEIANSIETPIDFSAVRNRLSDTNSPLGQLVISPTDYEVNPPTELTSKNTSVIVGPDQPGAGNYKYRIELNWHDKSSNEAGFIIYRRWKKSGSSLSDQNNFESIGKVGPNTEKFIDLDLKPKSMNDEYCYKVTAFKESPISAAGNPTLIESTPSKEVCSIVDPEQNINRTDSDNDGVPDPFDKCISVHGGVNGVDGCPDIDGDGVADFEDNCPGEFIDGGKPAGPSGTRIGPYLPQLGCPINYNLRWTQMRVLNNSQYADIRPYAYYNEGGNAKDLGEGEEPYLIFSWINGFSYGASRKGMIEWCCGEKVDVKKGQNIEPDQDEDGSKNNSTLTDYQIINQGGLQVFPESGYTSNKYAPIDPVNGLFLATTLMEKDEKLVLPPGNAKDYEAVILGMSKSIIGGISTCVGSGGFGCFKAVGELFGELIKGIFGFLESDPPPVEVEDPDDYMGTDVWHIDRQKAALFTQFNGVYNFKIPYLPTSYWFNYRRNNEPVTMMVELCFCLVREGVPEDQIKQLCSPEKAKVINTWPIFKSSAKGPNEVWVQTKYNAN